MPVLLLLIFAAPTLLAGIIGRGGGTVPQVVIVWILAVVLQAAYFLPLIIAKNRQHRQLLAIGVLNLFAGWTVIGWIGALFWAHTNPAPVVVRRPLSLPAVAAPRHWRF